MFTGLIEAVGEISEIERSETGIRMRVRTALGAELRVGDSLAVDGVCLTVVRADGNGMYADVAPETARVTTLGAAAPGTIVNLERPLRADARLGGHFVQGHVDGTADVEEVRHEGDSHRVTVRFPAGLAPYIVRKGSIAVNGVSLTVADVGRECFDVQIIPYTWTHTNLGALQPGNTVNIECDILAKYVARAMGKE